MASGDTKTEAMLNALGNGGSADEFRGCCNTKTQQYILDAIDRVQNVEDEVEELKNNPDVVDIVDTYADLQAYDTQHLTDNDIIRVLQDETHSGNSTYYRFTKNPDTWTFIGEVAGGGGGAKFIELTTADYNWNSLSGETGTPDCVALWLLPSGIYKGPASTSIEVQATRSKKYSMGAGFPGYAIVKECENTSTNRAIVTYVDGSNGNVVEYYSIGEDGTGYSTKNFPNVVQTTGTSTTNVMSQNAVTSMVFADPNTTRKIQIGNNSSTVSSDGISIGYGSSAGSSSAQECVAIGSGAVINGGRIGSVALGANSGGNITKSGMVDIGSAFTSYGYEGNSNYRLLTGLHDPVNDHDAATKGYVDANAGGPTVVQSMGNSTTDVMSQNSVTGMIYSDTSTQKRIKIGYDAYSTPGDESIEIGKEAKASNTRGIAIGAECKTESGYGIAIGSAVTANGSEAVGIGSYAHPGGERAIAIGRSATANKSWSVALGAGATTSAQGEVNVGTGASYTTKGYNNSNYRLISGVYDGQTDHDAVTVGQVNSVIDAINTALSTNIPHIGA